MARSDQRKSQLQAKQENGDVENLEPPSSRTHKRERSLVDWALPKVDFANVQSKLNSHEHFEVKSGNIMSGLPKFHDLTA